MTEHTRFDAGLLDVIEGGWDGKHVVVIGDAILDRYVFGDVARISPEAPVPVVHAQRMEHRAGGSANVASNLVELGARSTLVAFAGDDSDGLQLRELLKAPLVQDRLVTVPGFPTSSKHRVIGGNQQMIRVDFEHVGPRPSKSRHVLREHALGALADADAVVISDYAKGTLDAELCRDIIQQARAAGIPLLVDPKGKDFSRYRGATTICPNLKELSAALNSSAERGQLLQEAQRLLVDLDVPYLTVTMSEHGIAIVRPDSIMEFAARPREVYDVSGAGDTVVAVLALCMATGVSMEQAAELANVAAGIVIGKLGTSALKREELLAELASTGRGPEAKILSRRALKMRVLAWQAAGQKVVLTNGCFDILHAGHLQLLQQCRELGSQVVVAVNSDASVRRLKGPKRPLVREEDRARLLASLVQTDAVVVFEEDTPLELIEMVRPDVLVKGGDYGIDQIVGAKEVMAAGGTVHIVPLREGESSTRLIQEMSTS